MDNYLASGSLQDSQNFYFNLSFELLNGCQFNCKGCHVDKEGADNFTDESYHQLKGILESFSDDLYKPFIAFINPTDFMSAGNTVEVLSDPRVVEILGHFKRLSFQSTFLKINTMPEIAEVLHTHYPDHELEINILIEPDHIENKGYLSHLKMNQDRVIDMLQWKTPVRRFGIMNVFNYDETRIAKLLQDYEYMHKKVEHLFETTIDFNFSLGRKDKLLTTEEFYAAADRVRRLFNDSVVTENKSQYLRFSFGRLNDSLVERQYNWMNGKFYYSPLLYERYVSFIPELEIPIVENTAQEFEAFEEQVQLEQYMNVEDKTECGDCPLLGSCVDRGILHLMDIHGIKDCLVARDAMHVVNAMGALPYGSN